VSQTHATWMFVTDLDDTFVLPSSVHQPGLAELSELLASREGNFVFAVATGRSLAAVRELFDEYRLPHPDFVLASVGTRIHGGLGAEFDATWDAHLDFQWLPEAMRSLSEIVPGMRLQEPEKQDRFKVSFYLDAAFELASLSGALSRLGLNANVIISQGKLLDLLPLRASKGRAVYYLANKLEIPGTRCGRLRQR
jgi:sucrose-phosphate synthase